jgi:hypothetical protein
VYPSIVPSIVSSRKTEVVMSHGNMLLGKQQKMVWQISLPSFILMDCSLDHGDFWTGVGGLIRIGRGVGSVGTMSNLMGKSALSECCGYWQGCDGGSFMVLFRDSKL